MKGHLNVWHYLSRGRIFFWDQTMLILNNKKAVKKLMRHIFIILYYTKFIVLLVLAIFHPRTWRPSSIKINSNLTIRGDGALIIKQHQSIDLIADQWSFTPLSYVQLLSHLEKIENSNIVLESSSLQSSDGCLIDNFEVIVDFSNCKIYAITLGGWLPPFFAIRNANVIVDRNVYDRFNHNFKNVIKGRYEWIDVLNNLSPKIDVLWYALEANKKRHPASNEIDAQLKEAFLKIRKELPGIKFVRYDIPHKQYIEKIIGAVAESVQRRKEFLKVVFKYLKPSSKYEVVKDRWDKIICAAIASGLEKNDVCVILAMLCVSAPQKESPGIGIIKPDENYDDEKAYNAALDIQLMELFINKQKAAFERGLDVRFVILTSDKDLAKLGSFLSGLYRISSDGQRMALSVLMPTEVFGRNSDELKKLYDQLVCA